MPKFGGFSPFPRKFGGGVPRPKIILDSLQADNGTAYTTDVTSNVYVEDLASARAISAAWGTNIRLGHLWSPERTSEDIVARWEKMFAVFPNPNATWEERRARIASILAAFGRPATSYLISTLLSNALGSAFVAVEYISYPIAHITVPDGSYPWGTASTSSPWSSSIANILVRLQRTSSMTETDFQTAAAKVIPLLEPVLPAWATVSWYRPGPVNYAVTGGPSAAGFYLDTPNNLDNQILGT